MTAVSIFFVTGGGLLWLLVAVLAGLFIGKVIRLGEQGMDEDDARRALYPHMSDWPARR